MEGAVGARGCPSAESLGAVAVVTAAFVVVVSFWWLLLMLLAGAGRSAAKGRCTSVSRLVSTRRCRPEARLRAGGTLCNENLSMLLFRRTPRGRPILRALSDATLLTRAASVSGATPPPRAPWRRRPGAQEGPRKILGADQVLPRKTLGADTGPDGQPARAIQPDRIAGKPRRPARGGLQWADRATDGLAPRATVCGGWIDGIR